MADSSVDLSSASGNVDTRTEGTNGNHRQVVVLGDPATNAGVAPVDATAGLKVDLGADNDISGTVTAELSAVDNAVLDTIDAVLDTINGKLVSGTTIGDIEFGESLPAGTNNIGDVDVLSLPDALQGSGSPSVDSYTTDDVNLAANTANQSVISAPGANKQIWVYGLVGTADAAGSISIQDEDDTALSGIMPVAANGGFVMNPSGNFSMPWIKVATNKALEIDTVTCAFDGIITYAIVSV